MHSSSRLLRRALTKGHCCSYAIPKAAANHHVQKAVSLGAPSARKLSSTSRRLYATQEGGSAPQGLPSVHLVERGVDIVWPGQSSTTLLPRTWLRDHCRCKDCVNPDTAQKSYDLFSSPKQHLVPKDISSSKAGMTVTWHGDHVSEFSWSWIQSLLQRKDVPIKRILWGAEIGKNPPSVQYEEVMNSDAGVGEWTKLILEYGFCFVDGVPVSPEKTQELLERIAFIRETHYGGFYDFTSDLSLRDTAYTSLALPAHTDNTYFSDPSGLQMFHLLSHTSGDANAAKNSEGKLGGTSLLVDGFACAEELRKSNPSAFEILSSTPINWHASGNEGITIRPSKPYPVFNLDSIGGSAGQLEQLRWNNDDRGSMVLADGPPSNPEAAQSGGILSAANSEKWFDAAAEWTQIIRAARNEYWEQLRPGRALIFDNWRVMHGRSEFTGKRRICGGYINRDDFMSRYLNTNYSREEIFQRFI